LIAHARKNGHQASAYIDDIHCLAREEEKCLRGILFVKDSLRRAGIVESVKKYQPPSQKAPFLGLINNLGELKYEIPEKKLENILSLLEWLTDPKVIRVPTRKVASLYGKLAAVKLAVGPILRLLTRTGQKYYAADGAKNWDGFTDVRPFKEEMRRLIERLPELNGFNMFGKERVVAIHSVFASDASGHGFGLVKVLCGSQRSHTPHAGPCSSPISGTLFSLEERKFSSALRELLALKEAYADGSLGLRDTAVLHLTDSAAAEAVMRVGSPVAALQEAAVAIHESCRLHRVKLKVEWRPRGDARMEEADHASRLFDVDDFGLRERDYKALVRWAGFSPVFDLFASVSNAKCDNFASRFAEWGVKSSWVNGFSLDWATLGEVVACPPPGLITPVLRQFVEQKAKGILLIPRWKSGRFWPIVAPEGRHLLRAAVRFFELTPIMVVGPDVLSKTFRRKSPFLCIRIDGSISEPWEEGVCFVNCLTRGCSLCK
jgi:hypothetical protein